MVPAIDYEDLRRMVVEGAQRNGFDIRGSRNAEINSTLVLLLSGMATGIVRFSIITKPHDRIIISLYSGCMFPSQPDPDTCGGPIQFLAPKIPNLTIVQAFDHNGGENSELHSSRGSVRAVRRENEHGKEMDPSTRGCAVRRGGIVLVGVSGKVKGC